MEIHKGHRFELMPTGHQLRSMAQFAGCRRVVYNKALALQEERRAQGLKRLSYARLCNELTAWRNSKETPWLADAPCGAEQQALMDLCAAYTRFFQKLAAPPTFARKGERDGFRYPDPKQIKHDPANKRIFLPKLGWIRYRGGKGKHALKVLGELRSVTVSLRAGKWFMSIATLQVVPDPIPQATSEVGIDVGVARFATLSDGTVHPPLNSFRKHERRLAKAQRAMSRKTKFSKNWIKAKAKVQKIHSTIANARRDFLHKTSTAISKNHAAVYVEDLRIANMTRSAKGTVEKPGRNVRAKSGLNKSILDQGWGEFRRQLEYKLSWNGGFFLAVDPAHTSRTCPQCGHCSAENRKSQAVFACVSCGHRENADVVGAKNVLARGQRVMACGGAVVSTPVKQEPTEAITQGNA